MKGLSHALKHSYVAVPEAVLKRRALYWAFFFIMLFGFGFGATKFELDLSDESMFPKEDPTRIAYDFFRGQFGGDEVVYIVYKPRDGELFSQASLSAVRGLQEELLNYRLNLKQGEHTPLDHMVDVTSLVNVSFLEASDDALISRQFIGDRFPTTQQEREALRHTALTHPDYLLNYISKDGQYGGIVIRTDFRARRVDQQSGEAVVANRDNALDALDFDNIDITAVAAEPVVNNGKKVRPQFEKAPVEQYAAFTNSIYDIINKPQYKSVLEFNPVGAPVINEIVYKTLAQQANIATVFALLLVIASLLLLFRSLAAVVWPVVIVVVSAVLTLATLGWLGISMNLMVNVTILLVMVVGVANAVHILSGYHRFRSQQIEHRQALRMAYEQSGLAVLLTNITTLVGMLSLYLVPIEMVQTFGFSAALGVTFAYLITIVYLPIMIELWRPFSKRHEKRLAQQGNELHLVQRFLRAIEPWSYRAPKINISVFILITMIFLVGLSKIEINSNMLNLFESSHPMRQMYNLVDEKMAGSSNLEIMIDMGKENALKDPRLLNIMAEVQQYLDNRLPHEILKTHSLVDIVKDSNKALNGGRAEFYSIPQNSAVLDQTIFLFNNANPNDRRKVVSDDYRQARISVNMVNAGSKRYVEILKIIQPDIQKIFAPLKSDYPAMEVTVTGGMTIISKMIDYLSKSQIQGFGAALAIITMILFVAFQSRKLGFIAILPNLFPLIVMYGLMGFLGIPLDVDSLIVAPLMIGIVVDDTVHFLTHYRAAVIKHGDIIKAIQSAFREVGQAITFTTIILATSFLAFAWLDHQGLKHFGQLSALAITSALIADLFLLPALLVLFKATITRKVPGGDINEKNATGETYA